MAEPELWTVEEVALLRLGGRTLVWDLVVVDETGAKRLFRIPAITFAARVAEYGFDPDDFDTLLDYVLHETMLHEPIEPEVVARSTAGGSAPMNVPPKRVTLWNAPTIQNAREAQMTRVEELKARVRIVSPAEKARLVARRPGGRAAPVEALSDPLDLIRQHTRIDPADVAERRVHVDRARAAERKQRAARVNRADPGVP